VLFAFICRIIKNHSAANKTSGARFISHVVGSPEGTSLNQISAYRMFQSGKSSLTMEELKVLHGEYWDDYLFSVDQEPFLDELVSSQVLSRSGNEISFQHKYAYYFFVAKYFQEGMADVSDAAALSARLFARAKLCLGSEPVSSHLSSGILWSTTDGRSVLGDQRKPVPRTQKMLFGHQASDVKSPQGASSSVFGARCRVDEQRPNRSLVPKIAVVVARNNNCSQEVYRRERPQAIFNATQERCRKSVFILLARVSHISCHDQQEVGDVVSNALDCVPDMRQPSADGVVTAINVDIA
jgi:hypothetical protein